MDNIQVCLLAKTESLRVLLCFVISFANINGPVLAMGQKKCCFAMVYYCGIKSLDRILSLTAVYVQVWN